MDEIDFTTLSKLETSIKVMLDTIKSYLNLLTILSENFSIELL